MSHLFYLGFGATIFFALILIALLFFTHTSRATLQRIREVTYRGREFRRENPGRAQLGRRFFTTVHWVRARLGLGESGVLPERLANAGYRGTFPADMYNTARILCPALGFAIGSLIPFARLFWMIALPARGLHRAEHRAHAPGQTPPRKDPQKHSRRDRSARHLRGRRPWHRPGAVAGGTGTGISHPQITEELLQINREQRAGKPRIQAWADMAERSELADIDAFASMLMQTERFGTPIARALSVFADGIRLKRRQLAEQMAAKTTVKIIFPLVLFIFPSMFIVLLAPAVLSIGRGLTGLTN